MIFKGNLAYCDNNNIIGGKAKGLVALMNAHFVVPPTYIVIISGYKDFIYTNGKIEKIDLKNIASAIIECISNLGASKIILRSSSYNEDGEIMSYAGQYSSVVLSGIELLSHTTIMSSYLNMISQPLSNGFKVYCPDTNKILHSDYFAVLIQPYIQGKWSGVMFTTDPVSSDSNVLIEFINGNNEKVTSGSCVPAFIRIDSHIGKILEYIPGKTIISAKNTFKEKMICLSKMGKQLEQQMGIPQDIEWTYNDNFIFLQSRPITVLQGKKTNNPLSI